MPCQRMSSNAPSAVSSRTVWNHGDVTPAANFLAADFVSHNTLKVTVLGPDGYGRAVAAHRAALPDPTTTLEELFAAGDRATVRGTDRGTHQGEFMGRPAAGRHVTSTWIEIFRLQAGKAVEAGRR